MIAIIDYGLGNVLAFANVYRRLNIPVTVARDADGLTGASKLILPGVGAFDHAMERLDASGMRPEVERLVVGTGMPLLGVCVGMQMLAESSEEGNRAGLGWVKGTVKKFDASAFPPGTHLPHMGWNDVKPVSCDSLFKGMENDARFYFLHSFYFNCARRENVHALCNYHGDFCCAVRTGNIYGVQFHPEKSHHWGTRLLKNFAELT